MSDSNLSAGQRFIRQHAGTPRPQVDHNGRPTGEPLVYTYDDSGHLVKVLQPATPEPAAPQSQGLPIAALTAADLAAT